MSSTNDFQRPLFSLTVEEFISLLKDETPKPIEVSSPKRYVYGYKGIAQLFNCSIPTAARIVGGGKIDKAITQVGRKIIVDADLALSLSAKKHGGRK